MRRLFILLNFLVFSWPLLAQQRVLDSLLNLEHNYVQEDTIRMKLLNDLARRYYAIDPNTGLVFAEKGIQLGQKLADKKFLAGAYSAKGTNLLTLANYPDALDNYQKALEINDKIGNLQGTGNNFNNIGLVYYSIFNYSKALEFYQKTLAVNERTGNKTGVGNSLGNIGNIYYVLADYPRAITYFEKALAISENSNNLSNVAGNLVNLGNVYTRQENYPKALEYKQRALKISEQQGNKALIANNLGNIGFVYLKLDNIPAAVEAYKKGIEIAEGINDQKNVAFNQAGLAEVYFTQKNYEEAKRYAFKARNLSNSLSLLNTESDAWLHLSNIYEATAKFDSAIWAYRFHIDYRDKVSNAEKQKEVTRKTLQFEFSKKEDSLRQQQIITDVKLNQQILLAAKQQQELELKQNAIDLANKEKALQHLAYLKSQADLQSEQSQMREKEEELKRVENERQLQTTQVNLQETKIRLQDEELQTRRNRNIFSLIGLLLMSLLSFVIFRNFRNQQKSNQLLSAEKHKSDELLLNILPSEVAEELKAQGQAVARQFDEVTVLFTDFVDFTKISETLSAQELVAELHLNFKAFDEIIGRHGLEKIKTIGDAYMAVSGLPNADAQHAEKAALAAIEILEFVRKRQEARQQAFEIRIGLHSGPVVAGIVGVTKFAYDIWGDTVNTAARMESGSEAGKINISGATYEKLKQTFKCQYRGKISAKNKGDIDMYFMEEGLR